MDVLLHSRTLIAICQRRKSSECGSFLKPVASRRLSFLFERFERPSRRRQGLARKWSSNDKFFTQRTKYIWSQSAAPPDVWGQYFHRNGRRCRRYLRRCPLAPLEFGGFHEFQNSQWLQAPPIFEVSCLLFEISGSHRGRVAFWRRSRRHAQPAAAFVWRDRGGGDHDASEDTLIERQHHSL